MAGLVNAYPAQRHGGIDDELWRLERGIFTATHLRLHTSLLLETLLLPPPLPPGQIVKRMPSRCVASHNILLGLTSRGSEAL